MHYSRIIYAMDTLIDLKRLQHLVLLAEELNFSRAAERAFLSQTAFSRSIQALEAEFGMRLFDRGTRSVQPTTTGRHLITRAKELLARSRDLAQEVGYLAHSQGGTLSFGASLFAVDSVLPGVLPRLTSSRPGLRINVEVSQWKILLQHLESEQIEFFIAYPGDLDADPRFTVTPLASQLASVYCRAAHPLLANPKRAPNPSQVPLYPWAAVQVDKAIGLQLRALFGMTLVSELPLALSCDNLALLRETTLTSDTLLFTWSAWVQADLHSGAMVDLGERLRPALPAQARQLKCAIVRLSGRTLSPAAQLLIDTVANTTAVVTGSHAP
jgi:DNA-binding transcriptional LysR family regulator